MEAGGGGFFCVKGVPRTHSLARVGLFNPEQGVPKCSWDDLALHMPPPGRGLLWAEIPSRAQPPDLLQKRRMTLSKCMKLIFSSNQNIPGIFIVHLSPQLFIYPTICLVFVENIIHASPVGMLGTGRVSGKTLPCSISPSLPKR